MKNRGFFKKNILGRRKCATVRLTLLRGSGEITINKRNLTSYFSSNFYYISRIQAPLELLGIQNKYNLIIRATGGGLTSQATAIQLALARALVQLDQTYRKPLKVEGLLKCDSRRKERKKYGLKKARKAPQYSKR
uniref:Small ribosomal subunit protein uS9c n=1 Tax=Verdigellas peltata TaxID=542676 RepID=A0A170TMI3_9VIRI|nr:ribosomal protein S9 [Verdigellas peltata]CZF96640.1 ribosomal protein S9 [Verdigellas peltata]